MSKNKASKQVPKPAKVETTDIGEITKDLKKPAEQPAEPSETEFKPGTEEEVQEAIEKGDWARVRELRYGRAGIFKPGKAPNRVKLKKQ